MNYIGVISNKIHAITIGTYDLVIQLGYETKINPFSSFYQILSCVDVLCFVLYFQTISFKKTFKKQLHRYKYRYHRRKLNT
jgi:hypothetical protein